MNSPKSPYRRGADNGFRFGIYLTFTVAVQLVNSPLALLPALLLMLGVPGVVYLFLRRDRQEDLTMSLGTLWLDGLTTFFCGGLIAVAAMFVYLRWIAPDYIADSLNAAMMLLSEAPDPSSQQLAAAMREALEDGMSVSPIMLSMSMLWMIVSSGAIVSLPIAAVVARRRSAAGTHSANI